MKTKKVSLPDNVDHPGHYNQGGVECIDALESALGPEGFDGFCVGNALKYLWRWRTKNGIEDLKKARWYIDRAIMTLEKWEAADPRE